MKILGSNNRSQKTSSINFGSQKQSMIGDKVGQTQVYDMSYNPPKPISVKVTQEKVNDTSYSKVVHDKFRFYDKDNKLLGWLFATDGKEYKKLSCYANEPNSKYVNIEMLESLSRGYKGIGKKLVQLSIELSLKLGHGGRITLLSDDVSFELPSSELSENAKKVFDNDYKCPTGFYYEQCHLSVNPDSYRQGDDKTMNVAIESELARVRRDKLSLDKAKLNWVHMHLSEDNFVKYWLQVIKKNPILRKG